MAIFRDPTFPTNLSNGYDRAEEAFPYAIFGGNFRFHSFDPSSL